MWGGPAASLNADVRNALPDENGNGGNQELSSRQDFGAKTGVNVVFLGKENFTVRTQAKAADELAGAENRAAPKPGSDFRAKTGINVVFSRKIP